MLFDYTIFDNDRIINQTEPFQYASILLSLMIDVNRTVDAWEGIILTLNKG